MRKRADTKKEQEKQERLAKTGQITLAGLQGGQQAMNATTEGLTKQPSVKNTSPSPVRGASPQKQQSMIDKKGEAAAAALASQESLNLKQQEEELKRKEVQKYGVS